MECREESAGIHNFHKSSLFLLFPAILKPEYINRITSYAKNVPVFLIMIVIIIIHLYQSLMQTVQPIRLYGLYQQVGQVRFGGKKRTRSSLFHRGFARGTSK